MTEDQEALALKSLAEELSRLAHARPLAEQLRRTPMKIRKHPKGSTGTPLQFERRGSASKVGIDPDDAASRWLAQRAAAKRAAIKRNAVKAQNRRKREDREWRIRRQRKSVVEKSWLERRRLCR